MSVERRFALLGHTHAGVGNPLTVAGSDSVDPDAFVRVASTPDFGASITLMGDGPSLWAQASNDRTNGMQYYHGGSLYLSRTRGTVAAPADIQIGDDLGTIYFDGQINGEYRQGVAIWGEVEDTQPYIAASMFFGTKPKSNTNPVTRWRIDSGGGLVGFTAHQVEVVGGSKGPGTINAAGLFVNGNAVGSYQAYTVAALPAAGTAGRQAHVTDGAAALAWGATVTGGGSTRYLVWDNGTNWTVVGK